MRTGAPELYRTAITVACPRCGRGPGQNCRTRTGGDVAAHADRRRLYARVFVLQLREGTGLLSSTTTT